MKNICSMLKEDRLFYPSDAFSKNAHIASLEEYQKLYQYSIEQPELFWSEQARQHLDWITPFSKTLSWNEPFAKWFEDGKLNASENCLDRHLKDRPDKPAIIWEGEPGDQRILSFRELHAEVVQFAAALVQLGCKKGDVASIYMPMVPELVIAALACARIGITHTVIFAGFSAEAIAERNNDATVSLMITADGGWRRGEIINLKQNVDQALEKSPKVKHCVVLKRTAQNIQMKPGRDRWWHELKASAKGIDCPPAALDAEHPLFILYTSGSTGKPKGILHTTAGYLLGASLSFKQVFDYGENDIFWCTADAGWITGHSYLIYGPLLNGASALMYEGAPNFPDFGRFWQLIEKHKVSIFYTAPTAIRAFMKAGVSFPKRHNLSSLRLLGTVGEPINPEAWMWYREHIGANQCPIVDTWWQTETGTIMISPLPGAIPTKPGTATLPFFGIDIDIVDKEGKTVGKNEGGYLVIRKPWPSMLRTIFGDDNRYKKAYWDHIKGMYFTGDGARRDEHGYIWILGRIDDVLNVSGHRLSTMEIESTLVSHEAVAEAAVVGMPHGLKGEGIFCFVVLKGNQTASDRLKKDLGTHVAKQIGAIARPDEIRFGEALPKTRSGKIMRRLLRDIAAGRENQGDITTLEDQGILEKLRDE